MCARTVARGSDIIPETSENPVPIFTLSRFRQLSSRAMTLIGMYARRM
jgi:hypothetical protein